MFKLKKCAKQAAAAGAFMAVTFLSGATLAKDISLAWNPNTEPDIAGYNLYFMESGGIPNKITVTTNLARVAGLVEGRTYVFYATAFNTAGLESDPSAQISYTIPLPGPLKQMDPPIELATGGMQITSRGVAGESYAIQFTENFGANTQWATLQVLEADVSGMIRFTDGASRPRRFYRTIEVP